MEKLKLLEAKQAKDYADTDIEYRNKRIASLMLSLKDEQDAQTTNANNSFTIRNAQHVRGHDYSKTVSGTTVLS